MSKAAVPRAALQLTIARRRAQPTVAHITRLTLTAVFAYLAAQMLVGHVRPVLAPLTALLVVQASLFQTIHSAFRRVVGVTTGVMVAVGLAATVGFSWWVLGLLIAGAMGLGKALRLGNEALEVPISAMLIFSAASHSAATGRIVDTLIGATAGLMAGLAFAPLRLQPAREAVSDLAGQLADQLDEMAGGLVSLPGNAEAGRWLDSARALRGEIERVDDAMRQAEESVRLNPRTLGQPEAEVPLRDGLENLEHASAGLRVLVRSIVDASHTPDRRSPVTDARTRERLAAVLAKLASAVRTYGEVLRTLPSGDASLESELESRLAEAHRLQDDLADLLHPGEDTSEWPLRGEILAHVDRLRTELRVLPAEHQARRRRHRQPLRRTAFADRSRPRGVPGRVHRMRPRSRAPRDSV